MPARIHRLLAALTALLYSLSGQVYAQQFTGLSLENYSAVQQMPYNPAWVCHADDGTEMHVFSASGLLGTNAYILSKSWLTNNLKGKGSGRAVEDEDYYKDEHNGNKKYLWGNLDVLGPALSFKLLPNCFVGVYIRAREIASGGNLTTDALKFIGDQQHIILGRPVQFSNAGFTMHAFSELGVTYGAILRDNGYHRWRGGITVKYLIGLAAGSAYTNNVDIQLNRPDSLNHMSGDLSVKYSENIAKLTDQDINNDVSAWFNPGGKRSLGLDIGVQYEYHPNHDPNRETPYLFSIAASITDIGSIKYKADTGSAVYELKLKNLEPWQYGHFDYEPAGNYLGRMALDSFIERRSKTGTFRVGLPTALRFNGDINLGDGFAFRTDVLLNLRSTKDGIYNPGYAKTLCIAPRYERRSFMIALPFTFISHQAMVAGAALRMGPVFFGSSSIISCAISNHINSLDGYAGVTLKLQRKQVSH